ncbi:translational activator of cytochrome c oxidase 1-like [Lampris incognitus]|uniref:translational activator of cytochrome c oxidase 1-like n=1 Tax=Lampris incognitus TaxID=2546036 RepID=UPI0024B4E938|nr:translational activator of cytochrome c oxidase 1-like [Lampris incognitus]
MAAGVLLRGLLNLCPRRAALTSSSLTRPVCLMHSSLQPLYPNPTWGTLPVRSLQLCTHLCAGHNKWSKVKHVKGPKDAARSIMFAKFAMMIRIAVKEGGSNPEFNVALANIVEQCRNKNMPKASIEAAIRGAEKAKTGIQQTYEARGPGGCVLIIEVLSDSTNRSHQEIRRLLNKNGGALADGARHNFSRKGVVVVYGGDISMERAVELAIESGAEDVKEDEDEEGNPVLQFICEITDLRKVQNSLEGFGMRVVSASLEYVAQNMASLDQNQLEEASNLIEVLNDWADVVRVWDNIQAQA